MVGLCRIPCSGMQISIHVVCRPTVLKDVYFAEKHSDTTPTEYRQVVIEGYFITLNFRTQTLLTIFRERDDFQYLAVFGKYLKRKNYKSDRQLQ